MSRATGTLQITERTQLTAKYETNSVAGPSGGLLRNEPKLGSFFASM